MISSRDFAKPVVATIEALNSEQRRLVLIELEEAGSLCYSEILQRTGLDKGTLNYHLKKLVAAAMVRNFLVDQQASPYTSYYEVSELGRNLIEGLLSAFKPSTPHIRLTATSTYSMEIYEPATRREIPAPDAASTPALEAIRKTVIESRR